MNRVLRLCTILAVASLAGASPLAFIILNTLDWHPGRLPDGWQVRVNRGKPEIATVSEGRQNFLDFKSHDSSYGVERTVDVDPREVPYLTWKWDVKELPAGGDFRRARTDDQAAQVLVAFADKRVLTYIWDTTAPRGTMQSATSIPLLHIVAVVCRSGSADLNRWLNESRNLAQDYERAFGRPAPRVKGIRLQINTQHTGSSAESCFGEVAFRTTPQT